jgi:hypothetical protein
MKKRSVISLILFVSIIALTSANVYAAAATNTFKFTETYAQKVYYSSYGYYDVLDYGKFTITAKVSLAGVNITQFNGDTPFFITVGNFFYSGFVGDGIYNSKKRTTKIIVQSDPEWDEYGRSYQYLQIQLKWSATQLQITITGSTPTYEFPIWADNYMYDNIRSVYEETDAYIEFGESVKVLFDPIYIKGKATAKYNKKYEGDVSNIKLTGSGTGIPYIVEPD